MHVWINTREQSEQLKVVYEGKTKANYACTTPHIGETKLIFYIKKYNIIFRQQIASSYPPS